jgi:hypothetical protein
LEEQITIIMGGHELTKKNRRGRRIEFVCKAGSSDVRRHPLRQATHKLNRKA